MKPYGNTNGPCELCGYSDSDYTGDKYTRKIMAGYIIIINGSFNACNLRSQKTVTLFVTESEYSSIM